MQLGRMRRVAREGGGSLKHLLQQLAALFVRERRAEGLRDAIGRVVNAIPGLLYQREHRELFGLEVVKHYIVPSPDADALSHLSHRHYLSKRLDLRQRIKCALTHYGHESNTYDTRYHEAVYRDGGMILWSREADATHYRITLRENKDHRHEGAVSLMLFADDRQLSEMSFAWVHPSLFALDGKPIPFVTRNQLLVWPQAEALRRFRTAFPHNSPAYLCLAAMHGIAIANGRDRIATIRHCCQIAFEERYVAGFRNSYCNFWKSFGAIELDGQAYVMPVPLAPPALGSVSARHRRRAVKRRSIWFDVMDSASKLLKQHRRVAHEKAYVCAGLMWPLYSHLESLMPIVSVA